MRRTKTYLSDCSISLLIFTKARACKSIRSPVTVKTEIPKRKQNTSSLIIVAKTLRTISPPRSSTNNSRQKEPCSPLRLVFCHGWPGIFDAYESTLTVKDLWFHLSIHNLRYVQKKSEHKKKENNKEGRRKRERKNRYNEEPTASINRPEDKG